MWRFLRSALNFKYAQRSPCALVIERDEIIVWRYKYLRKIRAHRNSGRPIFYLDETWVNFGHVTSKSWRDKDIKSPREAFHEGLMTGLKNPTGRGGRLIILHVGNENGFIEDCGLVFRTSGVKADYHGDMTGDTFEKWFSDTLVPNLPPNSVIVMDNASYHTVRPETIPTSNSRKSTIQDWLRMHDIQGWQDSDPKAVIYELVKQNREKFLKYRVDEFALANGHEVVRLPPYHCELNPIEQVWAWIKHDVAMKNASFKAADVVNLVNGSISRVTRGLWANYVGHVLNKVEHEMWTVDNLQENVVENFVIDIGDNTSDSSETDDSQDSD